MDDRYQIIQRTAELSFGTQFEATDKLISRQAQIHRFDVPGEGAPSDWKKLYNEGSGSLTTLSHMGLPIIYDKGVNSAGPYLIRQLVDEPTLASRLEQGPLSEYEVWELAQQLLDIHLAGVSKGYFHGALSPERICYATRPGGEKRYYITDFGLPELHNLINGTQDYFGQPCLISLEQAEGEAPSESSEIFSIGQLLYLCLAENHPFASNDVGEMAKLHKDYPLAPISSTRDDIPEGMVNWMKQMTSTNPKARFATYAEALADLPGPVQTAPIPVIPTTTTQQQVAAVGQTTTVQQAVAAQTGTQAVSFATTTQAVTASQGGTAKSTNTLKQLLQEPLIIGGVVVVVILIVVGLFVFSDDGKEASSSKANVVSNESSESSDEQSDGEGSLEDDLETGLIVALNFEGKLSASNDKGIKVETLQQAPIFANGLSRKGLVLDKNHYYRLPLDGLISGGDSATFTVSLWLQNMDQHAPAFVSDEPWSGSSAQKIADKAGADLWQWNPENVSSQAQAKSKNEWSLLTMVISRKKNQVTVYSNGEKMGTSSTEAVDSLDSQKYLYIGCDSRKKFNFASPTVIDQLYIWDRKLSSKEVRGVYKEQFT